MIIIIYQIIYDIKDLNKFFKTIEEVGDFILINKTIFLHTSFNKQDLIDKIKSENEKDSQFIIKEINIESDDISNIRNWIGKVTTPKVKELKPKNPVEIMNDFIKDVENELNKQLMCMRSDGTSE